MSLSRLILATSALALGAEEGTLDVGHGVEVVTQDVVDPTGDEVIDGQMVGVLGSMRNMFMGGYNMMMGPYGGGGYGSAMGSYGGGYGTNMGHHNQGNNYSNQSGWDRGYNNTNANSYNTGGHMMNQGGFLGNNSHHHGMFRRLDAVPDELPPGFFAADDGGQVPLPPFAMDADGNPLDEGHTEDEIIDGQHWKRKYGRHLPAYRRSPYQMNYPYYPSYGGGGMMNSHGSNYGSNQGHYNQGNQYSNQSGWDRGYNNTNSNSYNNGAHMNNHGSNYGMNQANYNQRNPYYRRRLAEEIDNNALFNEPVDSAVVEFTSAIDEATSEFNSEIPHRRLHLDEGYGRGYVGYGTGQGGYRGYGSNYGGYGRGSGGFYPYSMSPYGNFSRRGSFGFY